MARPIAAGYLCDAGLHAAANERGENYWDIYLGEIAEQMGLPAQPVSLADLGDAGTLARYSALLLGEVPAELVAPLAGNLERWVRAGGVLLGLGTPGLDGLFGVRCEGTLPQPAGPFSQSAGLALRDHPLTAGLGSPLQPDQRLLIYAPVREMRCVEAVELGRLYALNGSDRGLAAIAVRTLGAGLAVSFGFGVAHTIWVLHKGQPVVGDRDGDGYWRTSDLSAIGANSQYVQYADELLWLIQNAIAPTGQPFISPLPPKDGGVPDLLCFWGGDDEAATNGLQRVASDFLHDLGLPYHINAMARDGAFGLSPEDAAAIQANGHEVSLHYNFRDGFRHPGPFRREDVLAQFAAFRQHFGFDPVCTVNHCTHWTGWSEPAEWMYEAGGRADNSFIHQQSPPGNPVNRVGFSFGSAFPHYFYRDAAGGNARFDFLEEPIVAYEVGYTRDGTDFPRLHQILDHAACYHLTLNMFYHPVYVAEWPTCQLAIKELLRYLDARQISAVHLGNDALRHWWDARHRSTLSAFVQEAGRLQGAVECAAPGGMIVQFPLPAPGGLAVAIDGQPVPATIRQEFGRTWAAGVVPLGRHDLTATVPAGASIG
jgi:hypothetical protein